MALSLQAQNALNNLNQILSHASVAAAVPPGGEAPDSFSDSDGLISFVNLSSSFVSSDSKFKTGQEVCDKVAGFFATMRSKVFSYLLANPGKVIAGDKPPVTQWDNSVMNYMRSMLVDAGGFTAFRMTNEKYSSEQTVVNFSTDIIKMIFDAMVLPENIVADATKFIQGVGSTLRFKWDQRSKSFNTCLLGICHEAVDIDKTGQNLIYIPKIKYYYISIDSSQKEFTSPCVDVQNVTFDFKYDYYVTAIKSSVLDNTTDDYKNFVNFLNQAQGINYTNAQNSLTAILGNTTSAAPASIGGANELGIDPASFPKLAGRAAAPAL